MKDYLYQKKTCYSNMLQHLKLNDLEMTIQVTGKTVKLFDEAYF